MGRSTCSSAMRPIRPGSTPNPAATTSRPARPATSKPGASRSGKSAPCDPNTCISAITRISCTADGCCCWMTPGPRARGRMPGRNNRAMQIFAEAGAYRPPPSGEPNDWIVHLNTGDLSLGTYSIPAGGVDDQTPHTEDEIYVVKTGRATLVTPSGTAPVGPGSVIYVPAGEEHRFTDVTDDLALIVVFAPPYGSRSLPGSAYWGWATPAASSMPRRAS